MPMTSAARRPRMTDEATYSAFDDDNKGRVTMNFGCAIAELLIQEHLHRPLGGDVLIIGPQQTEITPQAFANLLALYALKPRAPFGAGDLRGSGAAATITAGALIRALGDGAVTALGDSKHDGATIVHDLNLPLPADYHGAFDFVLCAHGFGDIFNAPQALMNVSAALKPGGRTLICNPANSESDAYQHLSPDWLHDYFAINTYRDCKIYILDLPDDGAMVERVETAGAPQPPQDGSLWHFDPTVLYGDKDGLQNTEILDFGRRSTLLIAEKADDSTTAVAPCQMHYRGAGTEPYTNAALAFRESPRPLFVPRTGEPFAAPSLSSWEVVYPIARWTRRAYAAATPAPKENLTPVLIPGPAGRMYHDILLSNAVERRKHGEDIDWPERIKLLRRFSSEGSVALYGDGDAKASREPDTLDGWRRIAHERDVAIKERDEARLRYRRYKKEMEDRRLERDRAATERDKAVELMERMKENLPIVQRLYFSARARIRTLGGKLRDYTGI